MEESLNKKGLLILTKTLGDVVLGNTLVKNIKLAYPGIELDYIVEKNYKALVQSNPNISHVREIDDTGAAWNDILRIMAIGEYDEIFCPQQTTSTDNIWHHYPRYNTKHLLSFYAQRCGIKILSPELELFVESSFENKWPKWQRPLVALHNSSLVDCKNWGRFDALSQKLLEKGFSVVQLGLRKDPPILGANKLDLTLKEIMQFFNEQQCDIFIGLDSGLSYVSSAFKVPTIALYGATSNITSGCYGVNTEIILAEQNQDCKNKRGEQRCHGILNGKCGFGEKCINRITVQQVLDKIQEKLQRRLNG